MQGRRTLSSLCVLLLAAGTLATAGCGRAPTSEVTNRLWVSSVPTSPRQGTTAFAIVGTKGRNIGVLHEGSVYESRHRMFSWAARGDNAKLTLLQSNEAHQIRLEKCKPSRGFDRCVMLHGDPSGAVRYQSRKRWALRGRRGKSAAAGAEALSFEAIVAELAAEDPELASMNALAPAAAASTED